MKQETKAATTNTCTKNIQNSYYWFEFLII